MFPLLTHQWPHTLDWFQRISFFEIDHMLRKSTSLSNCWPSLKQGNFQRRRRSETNLGPILPPPHSRTKTRMSRKGPRTSWSRSYWTDHSAATWAHSRSLTRRCSASHTLCPSLLACCGTGWPASTPHRATKHTSTFPRTPHPHSTDSGQSVHQVSTIATSNDCTSK